MSARVRIKRVYDPPDPGDGRRVLVDRLWPRGLKKERAKIDRWMKEVAPSDALRRWFAHDPRKWPEFRRRYRAELETNPALEDLMRLAREGPLTLLYATRDTEHNQARVLQEILLDADANLPR